MAPTAAQIVGERPSPTAFGPAAIFLGSHRSWFCGTATQSSGVAGACAVIPSDRLPTIEHMFVGTDLHSSSAATDGADAATEFKGLTDADVERELCELAAHINAATCQWLTLAAEFDRRGAHEAFGFVSCASWLAWRCSLTPRAAREQLRVARALEELPLITASFRTGRLSYSKVRALTRVAEPAIEEELLELAEEATAAQLERIVRGYRRATAPDEGTSAAVRSLSLRWRDDGTLNVRGNLPAVEGEILLKGLELAADAIGPDTDGGRPDRADALVGLAESAIANGISAAAGGDRHQVIVHWDVGRDGAGSATTEAGIGLSPEALARIGCDASLVTMVERDGEPLSVGRKTRAIPPALARALRFRDGGCRFPGCERTRFVDAHHIEHWADGGETSLDNLVQLCRTHHRLIHEGGFSVERTAAGPLFRKPSGRVVEAVADVPPGAVEACREHACCDDVDDETVAPGSWGRPFDLDLTVWGLARRADDADYSVA